VIGAHGPDSGPHIEALVLGAFLVVAGLALFFRPGLNRAISGAFVGAGAVLTVGAFTFLYQDPQSGAVGPSPSASNEARNASFVAALEGLCLAEQAARDSQVEAARDHFRLESHGPLHEIAAEVGLIDRGVEADLLETMEQLEADLGPPATEEPLADDLSQLIEATSSALDTLGVEQNGCAA
jgi:hypothetical protein